MFSFPSHPSSFSFGSGSSATGRTFGKLPQFIIDWLSGLTNNEGDEGFDIDAVIPGLLKPPSESDFEDNTGTESEPNYDYGFSEYLEGLLSSVGAENELNREFNADEAERQREWSAQESALNRSWQESMDNTRYQRSVADLTAAGLNPILAATNGVTTTPSGAVGAGNSASYNVGGGDTLSSILNSIAGIASAISDFLPSNKVVQVFKALGKAK